MAEHVAALPRTTFTRLALGLGAASAIGAGALLLARRPGEGTIAAGASAAALLVGGHRANHGAGGALDRMLDELLDRLWDGAILGPIIWVARVPAPRLALGALLALSASFLSSYVRARGAALAYTVEESHVTRGLRYTLVVAGLGFGWLGWTVWVAAVTSVVAALVRTSQVAKEERA